MSKRVDLVGQKFGRLTVLSYAGPDYKGRSLFRCICECGNEKVVLASYLKRGSTSSCGCIVQEMNRVRGLKHGQSRSKIYSVWQSMRQRCYNLNSSIYSYYGGRGIVVCDEWKDFKAFYGWAILHGYKEGLSLDRIDVNGNYCPDNCRWVTMEVQGNNRRNNHTVTYMGETLTITEWARKTGISATTLTDRLRRNLPIDEVFKK